MKIRRIPLSKDILLRMESADRTFLLLAGHMLNELNSLHKVFGWCLHNRPTNRASSIEGLANGKQAMIYARILAGKLFEAREVLTGAFFHTKLWQRVKPRLDPIAQEALKEINKYFNNSKTVRTVRNSFAFHYSAPKFDLNWRQLLTKDRSS
jgi:hypothetical protein